jgi:myo-inositol catabolism protein IolS
MILSKLGIGTYQFSSAWKKNFSRNEIYYLWDKAVDLGFNYIDLSDSYDDGYIERLFGYYIKKRKISKKNFFIATRFGQRFGYDLKSVKKSLFMSLKNLNTDHLDIYFFHSGSNNQFMNDELWYFLNLKKKEGIVKNLGLALKNSYLEHYDNLQLVNMIKYKINYLSVVYNPIFRNIENYSRFLLENKIKVIARVPLAKGLLSGKYDFNQSHFLIDKKKQVTKIIHNKAKFFSKNKKILPLDSLTWIKEKKFINSISVGFTNLEQLYLNSLVL